MLGKKLEQQKFILMYANYPFMQFIKTVAV